MRSVATRLRRLRPSAARRPGDRGSAEIGVAVVTAAVVVGSLLGTGVARTAVEVTDGVTWLADAPTGQVVEINPATLEPQSAALVGLPGQQLVLSQERGRLVVANKDTGALTSIDLATLLASGRRDAAPGDAVSVLLDRGRAFLVDRGQGLVANIDPVTLATRGRVWLAPQGLRDATVDGSGSLWAASGDDTLTRLSWSDASLAFTVEATTPLREVGRDVRLVAHDEGVTAVSPDTGAIVQAGTGHDLVGAAPRMKGAIAPAESSPSTLVPVSVPADDVVVLVRDGARVVEVDTAGLGCRAPGVPVELSGTVYVPCTESGKVIRLDDDGRSAGPDILTGDEGAPELVVDDGTLLVNVPGSTQGVKVAPDGTTTSFVRFDESLEPADLDRDDKVDEKKAEDRAAEDRREDRERPKKDPPRYDPGSGDLPTRTPGPVPTTTTTTTRPPGGSATPGRTPTAAPTASPSGSATPPPTTPVPGGSATPTPEAPAPQAPVITAARATGPSSADVTWTQPGAAASGYEVLVDGSVATRVSGGTTSVSLGGLPAGSSISITVRGTFDGGRTAVSAPAAVTPAGAPGAPTNVQVSETARSTTTATFAVSWDPAAANGSAVTSYAVAASGAYGSDSWSGASRSASVTVPCDAGQTSCGTLAVSVTATNGIGTGPSAGASVSVSPTPGPVLPSSGATVFTGQTTDPMYDGYETTRQSHLTLAPPSDWSGFTGVCEVRYPDGTTSGPSTVPCSSTAVDVEVSRYDEMLRRTNHSVVLVAYDPARPGTVVESATFSWTVIWPIEACGGTTGKICP